MEENIQESVEKIKKEANELEAQNLVENMVKDNKMEFEYEGIKYRVNKPTFEQKQLVNKERVKKLVALLKDPEQFMEKDLIAIYETRGISIKEIDDKFNALQKKREDFAEKLGKGLAEKKDIADLEVYKKEIEKIISDQSTLMMERSVLLDSSIESQINVFVYTYLAFLTTEKYVRGKDLGEGNKEADPGWQPAWSTYTEFTKEPESVVNQATWLTTYINKNEVTTS